MKKVNFKVVLMALSFAFSFLILGANRMEAQTGSALTNAGGAFAGSKTNAMVYSLPQGSFQSTQAAQNTLMA